MTAIKNEKPIVVVRDRSYKIKEADIPVDWQSYKSYLNGARTLTYSSQFLNQFVANLIDIRKNPQQNVTKFYIIPKVLARPKVSVELPKVSVLIFSTDPSIPKRFRGLINYPLRSTENYKWVCRYLSPGRQCKYCDILYDSFYPGFGFLIDDKDTPIVGYRGQEAYMRQDNEKDKTLPKCLFYLVPLLII